MPSPPMVRTAAAIRIAPVLGSSPSCLTRQTCLLPVFSSVVQTLTQAVSSPVLFAGCDGRANTFLRTPNPLWSRRRDGVSSGARTSARCASAHRATRSRAARPFGVTSTSTDRRSRSGAPRRTQPRSAIALIELDIVGRLTPWSAASSVRVRGCSLRYDSKPKCAGAGSSPADRSSAATVRMTSGMISRTSRALSRA